VISGKSIRESRLQRLSNYRRRVTNAIEYGTQYRVNTYLLIDKHTRSSLKQPRSESNNMIKVGLIVDKSGYHIVSHLPR
jgi:hypothetical protein